MSEFTQEDRNWILNNINNMDRINCPLTGRLVMIKYINFKFDTRTKRFYSVVFTGLGNEVASFNLVNEHKDKNPIEWIKETLIPYSKVSKDE